MENTMLGNALREVSGPLKDQLEKLSGPDGEMWLVAWKRFLRKENPWPALLSFIDVVEISGTDKFVASHHFTTNSKEVMIACIWEGFSIRFLRKVEEAQVKTTLRISKPKKDSLDAPILDELGGKVETTLANIWELLKKQPNGQSGKLLINGVPNIFYVRDAEGEGGVLWTVLVDWNDGGWNVHSCSTSWNSAKWGRRHQVFSHNS